MLMFRKGFTPAVNYSLARLNANTMFMDFKLTLRFQFAFFFFLLAYIHCQAFNYYFSFSSVDTPCVYSRLIRQEEVKIILVNPSLTCECFQLATQLVRVDLKNKHFVEGVEVQRVEQISLKQFLSQHFRFLP